MQKEEQEERPPVGVEDDRESIWTIPTRLKRWYFVLFSVQVIVATGWIVWIGIEDTSVNGASETLLHLWQHLAPAAIASATFALVIVDTANGIMVLSTWLEEVLERRRERDRERRRIEIKAAAQAAAESARVEAAAEVQKKWLEWNRRREAAASSGEEFNEPPPGVTPETQDPQQE